MPQKNIFPKTFRCGIKLDELYGVAKSFQGWSFYFYAHKLPQRPPVCFAQAYRIKNNRSRPVAIAIQLFT